MSSLWPRVVDSVRIGPEHPFKTSLDLLLSPNFQDYPAKVQNTSALTDPDHSIVQHMRHHDADADFVITYFLVGYKAPGPAGVERHELPYGDGSPQRTAKAAATTNDPASSHRSFVPPSLPAGNGNPLSPVPHGSADVERSKGHMHLNGFSAGSSSRRRRH